MSELVIVHDLPPGPGWAPVHHMADLAARLLDTAPRRYAAPWTRRGMLEFLLLPRRRIADGPDLLLFLTHPAQLRWLCRVGDWRRGFRRAAALVVDSFWTDGIPRRGLRGKFDQLFVLNAADVELYAELSGAEVAHIPWGTDALDLGVPQDGEEERRDIDLLRLGRQPPEWDDDAAAAAACARAGIRHRGRLPFVDDWAGQQRLVMAHLGRAKFVLAHSNLAAPAPYTHPSRDYVTARWTDALGCGATVAGVPPLGDPTVGQVFWPGALLPFASTSRDEGIACLSDALRHWSPETAARNRRMALERLDWRHALRRIAEWHGRIPAPLARDLARLDAVLAGWPGPAVPDGPGAGAPTGNGRAR